MLRRFSFRRTHAVILMLIVISLVPNSAKASMPTWQGVEIRRFAQATSDPSLILAIGDNTLFKSNNGGNSWTPLRVPIQSQLNLEWANFDPSDPHHLLVLARDGTTSRKHLFYESVDDGKTWNFTTPTTVTLPELSPSSTVNPQLLHLRTQPTDSSPLLLDTGYSIEDVLVSTNGESLILNNGVLWAFGSEKKWAIRHRFSATDSANTRGRYSNLTALGNSVLAIRAPSGSWQKSSDGGRTWVNLTNRFQTVNIETSQKSPVDRATDFGETHCRVQGSPASKEILIASCVWNNGSLPSRTCFHRSVDEGKSWAPSLDLTTLDRNTCLNAGLPGNWAPSTLLMDKVDPLKMLVAWMAGGVFRSDDGGKTWSPSDQGLRFRERHGGPFDFIAMSEPFAIRAVLYRDLDYLDQLLARGGEINEPGNKLSSVLDAELTAIENENPPNSKLSLWTELRARGASINPPEGRRSNLLKRALSLRAPSIVSDLISAGYDWGRPTLGFRFGDDMSTEIQEYISSTDPLKRRDLEGILDTYIHAGKFPAADVTVREMLENKETSKAVRVLKATTRKIALDKQSTLPRVDRLQLAQLLVEANEPDWAKRLFLSAKFHKQLVFNSSTWGLVQAVGESCNPKEIAWYVTHGMPRPWLGDCLRELRFPDESTRLKILKYMVESRSIDAEDWKSFLQLSSHTWIFHTKYHKLFEKELKLLPYAIVGIELGGLCPDCPFARKEGQLKVKGLLANYPAQLAGLQIGDQITHIDGKETAGMQLDGARKLLVGIAGSTVNVRILRNDQTQFIELERKPLVEP